MQRDIIHQEFPFTPDEVAAAWILHGQSVEEALRMGLETKEILRLTYDQGLDEEFGGSISGRPTGFTFVGGFGATLHLIADVHSGGTLLSPAAREAWIEQWPHRSNFHDVDAILDKLSGLGHSWAERRADFRKLLDGAGSED